MGRDYNKEHKDNQFRQFAYRFDYEVMHKYMLQSILESTNQTDEILELGSFQGEFTSLLCEYFSEVTCVEASSEAVHFHQSKIKNAALNRVNILNSRFEDVKLDQCFKTVVMTHVLEHIDDPISVLKKVKSEMLGEGGVLLSYVPNANALSRRIAVEMGLVDHNAAVTEGEEQHGHRVTYSIDTLARDVKAAGLRVIDKKGIFLKTLANFQWDFFLNHPEKFNDRFVEAHFELGETISRFVRIDNVCV